jgi:iron(III) transport system ATP-binding protein
VADLRCDSVAKNYGEHRVLTDINLAVPHGTLTAVLGASGSGKTTLLRLIMGFVRADSGRILLSGEAVTDAPRVHVKPEMRAIGYVAQEGALFPHLTVAENVGFGLPRAERKSSHRITEVLELVGMGVAYEHRHPHEISGGEQRRVALARALAPHPKMVLLDEPFSGLDAGLRVETREAVLAALADEETTSLLVTHDQAEAMSMGREVAVLRGGRLVQTATPDVLYHQPLNVDVARFVGNAVILPGDLQAGTVQCALGALKTTGQDEDGPVVAMIRPEQIEMSRTGGGTSESNQAGGGAEVTGFTYYGPDMLVKLTLRHEGAEYLLTARTFSHEAPRVGQRVRLAVSGSVMTYPAQA